MRRYSTRRNPSREPLTPEQRHLRYRAQMLTVRGEILRRGIAAAITSEDIDEAGYEACTHALLEAAKLDTEAQELRDTIRAAQDAAEEARNAEADPTGHVQ